jgi:luciferase-like monooxygenase
VSYAGRVARQMVMVGFLQAQNCTNLPASWRHPESRTDFLSADFYREIARVLELGKFHLAFFDDRLAMPDRFGNDHAHAVEHGIRCVKLDPIVVLMTMGMATKHLGLGATCSTTYYEPFHVARLFATVDLMTEAVPAGTSSRRSMTARPRTWAVMKSSPTTCATIGPTNS